MYTITRANKSQLILSNPVMAAAGTFGYGNIYRDMVNYQKLGAIVTNPITYRPRRPANGTRSVPLDSGLLLHTGLPNRGVHKTIKRWRDYWQALNTPVIVHLVATNTDDVAKSMEIIDNVDSIAAVELGLPDDVDVRDAEALTSTADRHSEKPLLVRLPLYTADVLAAPVANAGAGGLVVAAAPRGTARDAVTGRLVGGRIYGPMMHPLALRMVGAVTRAVGHELPVVGAGGIHNAAHARDFIEAGASAVQVDSVTWILPRTIELIARDLGGLVLTRETGAFADEWFTGIGRTDVFGPTSEDDTGPTE